MSEKADSQKRMCAEQELMWMSIFRTCDKRNDKNAEDVCLRVECAISELHASEARYMYFVDCRAKFMTTKHVKAAATFSERNAYDVALRQVTYALERQKQRYGIMWK